MYPHVDHPPNTKYVNIKLDRAMQGGPILKKKKSARRMLILSDFFLAY